MQYLKGEVTRLQQRNKELEDHSGLAERSVQLQAATEQMRVCEQVQHSEQHSDENFMHELDKMITSTGRLENTKHRLEKEITRNTNSTAVQVDAAQETAKRQARSLNYYKESTTAL